MQSDYLGAAPSTGTSTSDLAGIAVQGSLVKLNYLRRGLRNSEFYNVRPDSRSDVIVAYLLLFAVLGGLIV